MRKQNNSFQRNFTTFLFLFGVLLCISHCLVSSPIWAIDFGLSIEEYQNILAKDPTNVEAHFALGRQALFQTDFSKARLHLRTAHDLAVDNHWICFELGRLEFACGNFIKAAEYFLAAQFIESNRDNRRYFAQALAEAGLQTAANQAFLKARILAPDDAYLKKQQERFLRNYGLLKEAAQLYQHPCPGEDSANTAMNQGLLLLSDNRPKEAAIFFKKAIKLRPELTRLKVFLGNALLTSGNKKAAMETWQQAIAKERPHEGADELKDQTISAYPCLDIVMANLFIQLGQFTQAASRLKKIYTTYYSNTLAAHIFDDTLRLQLKGDPAFLVSWRYYQQSTNPKKSHPATPLLTKLLKDQQFPQLVNKLLEISQSKEPKDLLLRFGVRLLLTRLQKKNHFSDSLTQAINERLKESPTTIVTEAPRRFFLAAEAIMKNNFSEFARQITTYLTLDPDLQIIRQLLELAGDFPLEQLHLEGEPYKWVADPAQEEKFEKILIQVCHHHVKRVLALKGDARIEKITDLLVDFSLATANQYLTSMEEKKRISEWKSLLLREKIAFRMANWQEVKKYHQLASTLPSTDRQQLRKHIAAAFPREIEKLKIYGEQLLPDDDGIYNQLLAVLRAGDTKIAEKLCKNLPDHPDFIVLQARYHLLKAEFSQARELFVKALTKNKNDAMAIKYLGITHFTMGEFQEAVSCFTKRLQSGGKDFDTLRYLSAAQENLGKFKQAENTFKEGLNLRGPGEKLLLRLYADFLFRQKRGYEATQLYEERIEQNSDGDLHFNAGLVYLQIEDYQKAFTHFTLATNLSKDNPRINYYLAVASFHNQQLQEAKQALEKAHTLYQTGTFSHTLQETPYPCRAVVEAFTAIALGEWESATSTLQKHLTELSHARNDLLTDTEIIKGNLDFVTPFLLAETLFPEKFKETTSTDVKEGNNLLTEFMAVQQKGELKKAIELATAYLTLDPKLEVLRRIILNKRKETQSGKKQSIDTSEFMDQIDELRNQSQNEAALQLINQKLVDFPNNGELLTRKGEILWAEGRLDEADPVFTAAIEADNQQLYTLVGAAHVKKGLGYYTAAADLFFTAAFLNLDEAAQHYSEGVWALIADGRRDEAIKKLITDIPKLKYPTKLVEILAELMRVSGQITAQKELLEKWWVKSTDPRPLELLITRKIADQENVLELCEAGLSRFPRNTFLLQSLALTDASRLTDQRITKILTLLETGEVALRARLLAIKAEKENRLEDFLFQAAIAWQNGGVPAASLYLRAMVASGEGQKDFIPVLREYCQSISGDIKQITPLFEKLLKNKQDKIAQLLINVIADLYPYQEEWRLLQASFFVRRERLPEAIAILADVEDKGETSEELIFMLADLYLENKNQKAAAALLENTESRPYPADTRGNFLSYAITHSLHQAAFTIYKSLTEGDNNQLLTCLFDQLSPHDLFAFYQAIPESELDDGLLFAVADKERSINLHQVALHKLEQLAKRSPESAKILLALGQLHETKGETMVALDYLLRAEKLATSPEELLKIRLERGQIHMDRAEFSLAESIFSSIKTTENDGRALKWLGVSRFSRGADEEALEPLREAWRRNPGDLDLLRYLAAVEERLGHLDAADQFFQLLLNNGGGEKLLTARLYCDFLLRQGRNVDALLVYHQLLQRAESPDLYFNIALLYLKLQKWDKALYALQTAEQISDQPQPRVHYYLGRVFQEQKKINQANQQFETALRLFEEGMDDTIDGRTPYPCKAIIHASAAAATGEWRRCNEILGEHLVELAGTQSDLLSDVEVIKGNVDFLLPLRFRVGTKPSDQLTWKMEQIDSVFQLKHQLLDQFLAAQASNQLGDALTMGNAYLKIDPELSAVRERITEELVNN